MKRLIGILMIINIGLANAKVIVKNIKDEYFRNLIEDKLEKIFENKVDDKFLENLCVIKKINGKADAIRVENLKKEEREKLLKYYKLVGSLLSQKLKDKKVEIEKVGEKKIKDLDIVKVKLKVEDNDSNIESILILSKKKKCLILF